MAESNGAFTVDTSMVLEPTPLIGIWTTIGSENLIATNFTMEIYTCADNITFPNLAASYFVVLGNAAPTIDPVAATADSNLCGLQSANYSYLPSSSEITLDTTEGSPAFTVTANAYLAETIFTESVIVGTETIS